MTAFRFSPVIPHPVLSTYIAKMWVFESSGRLPALDTKLIVPNANFKLAFTFRNGLVAHVEDRIFIQKENQLSLTGLVDSPVNLDPLDDTETGTIIIEFNPFGAYRFFHFSYTQVKNQIVELSDLIGKRAEELQRERCLRPRIYESNGYVYCASCDGPRLAHDLDGESIPLPHDFTFMLAGRLHPCIPHG